MNCKWVIQTANKEIVDCKNSTGTGKIMCVWHGNTYALCPNTKAFMEDGADTWGRQLKYHSPFINKQKGYDYCYYCLMINREYRAWRRNKEQKPLHSAMSEAKRKSTYDTTNDEIPLPDDIAVYKSVNECDTCLLPFNSEKGRYLTCGTCVRRNYTYLTKKTL